MNGAVLKEKLNQARILVPGMKEVDYQFAECIASLIGDEIVPEGFVLLVSETLAVMNTPPKREIDAKLSNDSKELVKECLANARFILQILDVVADKDFTEEVRKLCREVFGWETTHMVVVKDEEEYPEYVKAAVDWWSATIQRQGRTVSVGKLNLPAVTKEFTEDEIRAFRSTLAEGVMDELRMYQLASLRTDYGPWDIALNDAALAAGIESSAMIFFLPSKASMYISKTCVEVCLGYRGDHVVVWGESQY